MTRQALVDAIVRCIMSTEAADWISPGAANVLAGNIYETISPHLSRPSNDADRYE